MRADGAATPCAAVLEHATRAGATAADAVMVESSAFAAGVRLGEVEKLDRRARAAPRPPRLRRRELAPSPPPPISRRAGLERFAADTVALARVTRRRSARRASRRAPRSRPTARPRPLRRRPRPAPNPDDALAQARAAEGGGARRRSAAQQLRGRRVLAGRVDDRVRLMLLAERKAGAVLWKQMTMTMPATATLASRDPSRARPARPAHPPGEDGWSLPRCCGGSSALTLAMNPFPRSGPIV